MESSCTHRGFLLPDPELYWSKAAETGTNQYFLSVSKKPRWNALLYLLTLKFLKKLYLHWYFFWNYTWSIAFMR